MVEVRKIIPANKESTTANSPGAVVVGLQPWLPWPLSRWAWWTVPVRAERVAALRIGLATVLLFDLLLTYLPGLYDFFGRDSLGAPPLFNYLWNPAEGRWKWSLLRGVEDHTVLFLAMLLWLLATVGLLIGCFSRLCAVLVWLLSASFAHLNPYIDNAGDQVRGIILLYLMLSPCGAVWSVDYWWKRSREGEAESEPEASAKSASKNSSLTLQARQEPRPPARYIHPWPLRLLFLQMVLIYFCNGLAKIPGEDWIRGYSLYYVQGDLALARFSAAQFQLPLFLTQLLTWMVLLWEIGFPAWVAFPVTRAAALWFGVFFHVGIWLTMEIGGFAPYMLTLYLPLVPWERLGSRGFPTASPPAGSCGATS